ncbi:MAG: YraN family protein [Elusimicrobia bacterium]|nr:YraN family protein [Elusimicrobiota bacterium]
MSTREAGAAAEALAAAHLESLGWTVAARNWRGRGGELDIVAFDGPTLVFVEVKARGGRTHGLPEEAVDGVKQGRLARTALEYARANGLAERPMRFDVAAVEGPTVRLIRAAFEARGWTR